MPESPWPNDRRLIVATTSPGKIQEVRMALADLRDWTIEPLPAGLPAVDESGATFVENAILKAVHYSRFVDGLALADDSGLCVTALNNRPGVHTARYGATDDERNNRILAELAANLNRDAAFHCAFVAAKSGLVVWSTEAVLRGNIPFSPVGDSGFGFDPIFFVPELRKTLAQLTTVEKNRISARGQALLELRRFLTLQ